MPIPPQQQHTHPPPTPYNYPIPNEYQANATPYGNQDYNGEGRIDITTQLNAAAHGATLPQQYHQYHHPQPQAQHIVQPQLPPHDPVAHAQTHAYSIYGDPHPVIDYSDGSHPQHPHHGPMSVPQQTSSVAWRHFADSMMNTMTPQWGADALMALGHGQNGSANGHSVPVGADGMPIDMQGNQKHWSLMGYSPQQGPGVNQ